jgi:hypothetical protein
METDTPSILDPTWVGHFSMITLEIKWYTFIVSFIACHHSPKPNA